MHRLANAGDTINTAQAWKEYLPDRLDDVGGALIEVLDGWVERALAKGKRGLARRIEGQISRAHDLMDKLETLRAELEGGRE